MERLRTDFQPASHSTSILIGVLALVILQICGIIMLVLIVVRKNKNTLTAGSVNTQQQSQQQFAASTMPSAEKSQQIDHDPEQSSRSSLTTINVPVIPYVKVPDTQYSVVVETTQHRSDTIDSLSPDNSANAENTGVEQQLSNQSSSVSLTKTPQVLVNPSPEPETPYEQSEQRQQENETSNIESTSSSSSTPSLYPKLPESIPTPVEEPNSKAVNVPVSLPTMSASEIQRSQTNANQSYANQTPPSPTHALQTQSPQSHDGTTQESVSNVPDSSQSSTLLPSNGQAKQEDTPPITATAVETIDKSSVSTIPSTADDLSELASVSGVGKFERSKIHDPNALLALVENMPKDQRISLDNARKHIVRLMTPKRELLRDYKTKSENQDSTIYLADWIRNDQVLQIILEELLYNAQFVITQRHARSARSRDITATSIEVVRSVEVLDDFVERLLDKLETCNLSKSKLWGDGSSANWYTFGVMIPVFFSHYLLMDEPKHVIRIVAFLRSYLPEPNRVTTARRERPYESYLLGPWLLRHLFDNTLELALKSDIYEKARAKLYPAIVDTPNTNGLHIDLSYFAYDAAVAFNCVQEMVGPRARMVYYLDTSLQLQQTYIGAYNAITDMVCHPKINLGNIGVFGRRPFDKCEYKSSAPYGMYALPCSSILVYKTPKSHFTVRGQRQNVAYYVADRLNFSYALHWVQSRQRYTVASVPCKFTETPTPGIICQKGNALVDLKPSNSLQVYMPESATSCVFAWENIGVLYQRYKIKEFGAYEVTELVTIDSNENTVSIRLIIKNASTKDVYDYYGENGTRVSIESSQTKSFSTVLYEDRPHETNAANESDLIFPLTLGRTSTGQMVQLRRSDSTYALAVDDVVKLAVPNDAAAEKDETIVDFEGQKLKLRFADDINQWRVE